MKNCLHTLQLVAAQILLVAIFAPVIHTAQAAPVEYSNWTVNLSGVTDTATGYYAYERAQMAVSGQYVHVVWLASPGGDLTGYRLFYRRSDDGGQTFGTVQTLVSDISYWGFTSTDQILAADGQYVHIAYIEASTNSTKYLRSTDNGVSFEAPKSISSALGGNGYVGSSGFFMRADSGKVSIAWSNNSKDAPYDKDVFFTYSNDAGATFNTKALAHSNTLYGYGVGDMIRSGSNIYVLYTVTDVNGPPYTGRVYLVSSNDGGQTFNTPNTVTVASSDTNFYAATVQGGSYTPNLAAVGSNVYVTWVNYEDANIYYDSSTFSLRFRKSTDGGKTLGNPITLSTASASKSNLPAGQETVAASGSNVFVSAIYNGSTMFWRSTDSGASFETATKISDGGWYPQIGIDPSASDGSRIYVSNYYISKSTDFGATFNGVINPKPNIYSIWDYPALFTIDSNGVIHNVATLNSAAFWHDIYYRRLPPAAAPGATPKALNLVAAPPNRRDNMQIAASPDINLASAMTVEFWVNMNGLATGDWYLFRTLVAKKRTSGATGALEIGYWDNSTGLYGRLVTENSSSQTWGDFLGSGVVPSDQAWCHIAMTYDAAAGANNWKYYVNGLLAGSATLTGRIVMDYMPLVLGDDANQYYSGSLQFSDFRIWNRARTAAEIAAAKNAKLVGNEPGLVALYTFNDTTKDMTGRGNDGVLMYKESYASAPVISAGRSDCIFNWAEQSFAQYFSPAATSATYTPYYYRYYSGTGNYLATSSADNSLYVLGNATGWSLLNLGPVTNFLGVSGCP